jgi:hypothetical protein
MSGVINKVKDALHSNKDHSTTHSTTGTHSTTTGTTGTHGTAEGVAGPHSSRAANAADPRVDSDLDSSRTVGSGPGHTTTGGYTGTGTGVTGTSHSTTGTHGAPVHNSNVANTLDPRVPTGSSTTHTGTTGTGYTGQHTTNTSGAGTGTHLGNTPGHHTGTTGGISHSTNAGPHNSNIANKADPTVDSDLDGRGNRHGASTGGVFGASGSHATPGSGTAQNTAGPHNSDLANKLDPRVDADLDGSKTIGGNKTHT